MDFKKGIKLYLKNIVGLIGFKLYKVLKLVKKYTAARKAKALISKFQSAGYGVRLNGFNWNVSSPDHLIVGNNVHIGDGAYLKTEGGLIIGDNVHISRNLTIYTVNHDYNGKRLPYDERSVSKPVKIEKNVWIGMNVSILPGVTIGEGAIIGMGAVVNRDVEPNEIVGGAELRTLKRRNNRHYSELNNLKQFGGRNGNFINVKNFYPSYLDISSCKLCFILGTGRCGTKSIAANLDKHNDIYASHEEIKQFMRLSTELAHKVKSEKSVKEEVYQIFKHKTLKNPVGYKSIIHSDQRLWNMIPILKEIFPDSKFIHLIRDGRNTVRSMYARNWFADNEFELNQYQWAEFRLNGSKAGEVEKNKWESWGSFERCCWYWAFINKSIYQTLKKESSYLIKLENLNQDLSGLLDYLDITMEDFKFEKYNPVKEKDKKTYQFEWSEQEEELFQEIAGKIQDKFYS